MLRMRAAGAQDADAIPISADDPRGLSVPTQA